MILPRRQRKPNRLRQYDYSQNGWYFVTICTKDKEEYFGQIKQSKMIMTDVGNIARKLWFEITKHFDMTSLDEFIVMPNHIHGIIVIGDNREIVGNRHACSLQNNEYIKRNHQLLFTIIGSFKSAVSKIVRQQLLCSFQWQRSFYDHIIRNEQSLHKIREYIQLNPLKWSEDENNNGVMPKIY
ncbi:MAG TPA: transposase [Patescibacteria group bacterium]|nr:transposase [Patescibacteria group bacterium]